MLKITGYADRLYCRPGDTIAFKVNCEYPSYLADIVRIICGDSNPEGPGIKEQVIESSVAGQHVGRRQVIHSGSYISVEDRNPLHDLRSFTIQALIWPTTPLKGRQGIITKWSSDNSAGFALFIDELGRTALQLGDGSGAIDLTSVEQVLQPRQWYRVSASFDWELQKVQIIQDPLEVVVGVADRASVSRSCAFKPLATDAPLLFAATAVGAGAHRVVVREHFNGKIDSPRITARSLNEAECLTAVDLQFARLDPDCVGAWDFSVAMSSQIAFDGSPNQLHGRIVNFPARAMTGWNWSGESMEWAQNPSQWGAIHFHDDDIYDAGWETDFELEISPAMSSGIYAARLRAGEDEEYIWFTIGPAPGRHRSIALLLPTSSYMAYANDHLGTDGVGAELLNNIVSVLCPHDLFLNEHWEYGGSLYDVHSDGSGICYSSRLRPLVNMRPKRENLLGGFGRSRLWQFAADTHITDWLEAMGYDYDVITDEELHNRGYQLLADYRVVVTGTHPEYCSTEMWDAVRSYRNRGGRLMYLGGDGFYWRIAYHPEAPGVIELRRAESGVRAWAAMPGEYYHSFDGRHGGLWARQGRTPQSLVGVGFAAQGFDVSSYYTRQADSCKPGAAFVFEGVGMDDRIGDFGLIGGGAAGLEIDRSDPELGTPPNAYLLARSECHTDTYLLVPEEFLETSPGLGGHENEKVHADIVLFTTQRGGAVFSVGSIAWAGSLSHDAYRNNVSQITQNVLRRFLDARAL